MAFIAHNPASAAHDLADHPEAARRAAAILAAFDADPRIQKLPRLVPDRPIAKDEALRTHSERLWHNLQTIEPLVPAFLDPDTYVVRGSVDAALTTARLSVQAAERALANDEPGFVVARPPGHHATHDRSMGFCLLNNVAVAARAALDQGAKRVLIFDHDVHHGNGTQDIFERSSAVLYQSFHLSPHYPGTGHADEIGAGDGRGFTMNAPLRIGDGEAQVRSLLKDVFLPTAREFRPDLVLVSAGFDSLVGDPLGGLELTPTFYGEIVGRFVDVCPRVVCLLEGGYQIDQIPLAAAHEVLAMLRRPTALPGTTRAPPSQRLLREALAPSWSALR